MQGLNRAPLGYKYHKSYCENTKKRATLDSSLDPSFFIDVVIQLKWNTHQTLSWSQKYINYLIISELINKRNAQNGRNIPIIIYDY